MVAGRIVVWCGDAPNHRALAHKLHGQFGVAAIVVDQKKKKNKKAKASLVSRIWDRFRFREIYDAWKSMISYYAGRYPQWPDVPLHFTPSINSDDAFEFTKKFDPVLIVVSGTGLVKEMMLNIGAKIGIINLHTCLSPYVKGGPNCTNWCIANKEWHLVGNTIMWINSGIDSGNIITSETIDVRDCSNLAEVQKNVMEHAHDLYLRAVDHLLKTEPPYISVPQSEIGEGN
jgi:methionyl-tRNA formyltransferase